MTGLWFPARHNRRVCVEETKERARQEQPRGKETEGKERGNEREREGEREMKNKLNCLLRGLPLRPYHPLPGPWAEPGQALDDK